MLFRETLDRLQPTIDEALDELFDSVISNQTHPQDLLLIEINGFYNSLLDEPQVKKRHNLSPFVFGPGGWVYYTDATQYRFYYFYRRQISPDTRSEFFKDYNENLDKQNAYDITMQIELMVYLKFWESDVLLKKMYQLSNLAQGNNYDWYFQITDKDSRYHIIADKIRDPIEKICPKYFRLLKDIYLSQIRYAAAHTDYYIVGQSLGFNNVDLKNHAPLSQVNFEDWEERFHKLILLYNGLIRRFNESLSNYKKYQEGKEFGLSLRLTRKDGSSFTEWVKYVMANREDWIWYQTWKKHFKNG